MVKIASINQKLNFTHKDKSKNEDDCLTKMNETLPIQDRLKSASTITVESAKRNKVDLKVTWYDVHGEERTQSFSLAAGSIVEF